MEMGTGLCHGGVLRAVVAVAILLSAAPALAQNEVMLISGGGVTPALREGARPNTGTVVTADAQTVVVLKRTWSAIKGQSGAPVCQDWVILRGRSYTIEPGTPGVCNARGTGTEVERALGGEQMVAHLTVKLMFVSDPKADDPNSSRELSRLQQSIGRAKRDRNSSRGRQGAAPQPANQGTREVTRSTRVRGTYVHARFSSLQCLHRQFDNWQNGNPIHLWQCSAGAPDMRMWQYDEQTGYIRSAANLEKCWHKARRDWANGNPIHLWDCSDGLPAQKTWTYDHQTGLIRSRVNPAKCIHKKNGGFDNGNPVHLWDCDAGKPEFKSWTMRLEQTRLVD
jgi:hypothetical protein